MPLKLGFLASGGGSSARAIVEAIGRGLPAEARLLVSNKRDAPALAWARDAGVACAVIPTMKDAEAADRALAQALSEHGVELLVLSGYLRKLGPVTLAPYAGRILNIHPGPLPEFGGQGMYGAHVHEAVVASGRTQTAIVIHLVDGEYDRGPELARRTVPIEPGETAASLEAKVRALEPELFVETMERIASGEIALDRYGAGAA